MADALLSDGTCQESAVRAPALAETGGLALVLRALGVPVAAHGFAVALEFDLAVNGVATYFAAKLARKLLAVPLVGDREGNFAVFELALLNFRFLIAPRQRAG